MNRPAFRFPFQLRLERGETSRPGATTVRTLAAERAFEEPAAPPAPAEPQSGPTTEVSDNALLGTLARESTRLVAGTASLEFMAGLIGDTRPGMRRTCRIEFDGTTCWSPGYSPTGNQVERAIEVRGQALGRITIGYPDLNSPLADNPAVRAWAEAAAAILCHALSLVALMRETAERENASRRDRTVLTRAERLLDVGIWEFDPQTSAFTLSERAKRMLGLEERSRALQRRKNPIIAPVQERVRGAREPKPFVHEFATVLDDGLTQRFEAFGEVCPPGAGTSFGFVRAIRGPANAPVLVAGPDTDLLTQLPNRRALDTRLQAALLKRGATGALVLLDVRRFGEVNTTRGHDFGDAFLRAVARRLKDMARTDFIARIGGNEFAFLLEDIPETLAADRGCAFVAGMKPVEVFGHDTAVCLSVGVATFPSDGRETTELMANASMALGAAKREGPNSYVRFTPALRDETVRRVSLRAEMQAGLRAGQFVPFYQPKVNLRTGEIAGFEVLGRWNHPSGMRQPGYFVPALEDEEISKDYFQRLLDRVLTDLVVWRKAGLPFGRVAINTSSSEYVNFDLAAHVLRCLKEAGLPPSVLGVEITETVILGHDDASTKKTLGRLRAAGVEVALDDFGTGYASLTHLANYPIDVVKIDRSFIDGISKDEGSRAIVAAVLGLGATLGLTIVAEGVETVEQAALLKASVCDEVQGFLFARPMPASDVPGFLSLWRPDTVVAIA